MIKFVLPLGLFSAMVMGVMVISDTTDKSNLTYREEPVMGEYVPIAKFASPDDLSKHSHKHLEVADLNKRPNIRMTITEDAMGEGWNIKLDPENFTFTPENVNKENVDNEGHTHLYIDDQKVARVYGQWFYLYKLAPGPHRIKASLNANRHDELVVNGEPILASVEILQK